MNFTFGYFSKKSRENSDFRITDTFHKDLYIFIIIFRSNLLRMTNISDKTFRENQNTYFTFGSLPHPTPENRAVYEII